MLISLVLFGSRARGDQRLASDVDLLGVVDTGFISRAAAKRGVNFYQYPIRALVDRSSGGDLFLLHLTEEGKILHDTANLFQSVCDGFRYKETYDYEIRQASAIIFYFVEHSSKLQLTPARKRLIWAMRTIIVARAAEARTPHFSSAALEEFSSIEGLKHTLDRRFTIDPQPLLDVAQLIVDRYGLSAINLKWPRSEREQVAFLDGLGGAASLTSVIKRKQLKERSFRSLVIQEPLYM